MVTKASDIIILQKNIKPYCLEILTWSEHICGTTKKGPHNCSC